MNNFLRDEVRSLDGLLVGLGLSLVLVLVDLVGGSAESARDTAGDGVIGGVALGLLLVGLLAGLRGVAGDGLGDVVGGVGDGVADLADDTLLRLVNVGGRHFDLWWWLLGFGFDRRSVFVDDEGKGNKAKGCTTDTYTCILVLTSTCESSRIPQNDRIPHPRSFY